MKITSDLIYKSTGTFFAQEYSFDMLGLTATVSDCSILTFIESKKFIPALNQNMAIKGVFCTQELSDLGLIRSDIQKIIVDDPKWYFFSIVDYTGRHSNYTQTFIDPSSEVHETAFVSPYGVRIGKNCIIEPKAIILSGVVIADKVIIRAGAVIGGDGFEHKNTSKGILSVTHNGIVDIKNNVEIGANSFVAKGFSYRSTVIGAWTKLDSLVHYAHGVQSGEKCLIVANAMIAGNVTIGNNVWIGPSSSISNRLTLGDNSFITIGSIVVRDVKAGEKVTGNFAIPHIKFLKNLKRSLND